VEEDLDQPTKKTKIDFIRDKEDQDLLLPLPSPLLSSLIDQHQHSHHHHHHHQQTEDEREKSRETDQVRRDHISLSSSSEDRNEEEETKEHLSVDEEDDKIDEQLNHKHLSHKPH